MIELNKIYNEDCLDGMKRIESGSIDMILCDLPYGTTACKWDVIIPFEPLWEQYKRIIKPNGAIVLTASQPFTSALVTSNPKMFRYELIWEKPSPSNPLLAKKRVMSFHENICIFYKSQPVYNSQKIKREEKNKRANKNVHFSKPEVLGFVKIKSLPTNADFKHNSSVLKFNRQTGIHPTQKPVALFEYLIKTYTNEGETVLDNCMGSGTTAVACINTNRNFIGFEKDKDYFDKAVNRIENLDKRLFA